MNFYVGLHQPCDSTHFERAFISVNRLRARKSGFGVRKWIMDSGAFSELAQYGRYRHGVQEYAEQINRWAECGEMQAAVSQDYMCEPWIVEKTGLSVSEHQRRTLQRYMGLLACTPHYIMPVIQGFQAEEYLSHLAQYGGLLRYGMWVGVGSVCKRNGSPEQILAILSAIKTERPDLRLHGFGLKTKALASTEICSLLHSADSMAWSFAARKQGRNANSWKEAMRFATTIEYQPDGAKNHKSALTGVSIPDEKLHFV